MGSDNRRILIDGFAWSPADLLVRLRSPELPDAEFWRCMAYAAFVMRDDADYLAALDKVKWERTASPFPQLEVTTPQNELPDAPPRAFRHEEKPQVPTVFHDNLDEGRIVTDLLKVARLGLGQKQFALAVQEFFTEIGWLVNKIDTQYIAWLKSNQIMTGEASDLQHISRNDKMNLLKGNLKNTFQFLNAKGVWEDRDMYYKKNRWKINKGQ